MHKRHKYVYSYLENVDCEWDPVTRWKLNKKKTIEGKKKKIDITKVLVHFRDQTVNLAKKDHNLSDNRVLSFSNIFVITPDIAHSCLRRYPPRYYNAVTKAMDRKKDWHSIPFPVRTWCSQMDEVISAQKKFPLAKLRKMVRSFAEASDDLSSDSDDDRKNNVVQEEESGDSDDEGDDDDDDDDDQDDDDDDFASKNAHNDDALSMSAALLSTLVEKFKSWAYNYVLESTFISQSVLPFLDHVFQRHGMTTRVGESHVTKRPNSHMADYVAAHVTSTGKACDVLAVEIKPPSQSSHSQLESDFVKVGKELKDIIDDLVELGVDDPCAAGILIEGLKMTTYTMRLVSEGAYILLEHGQVSFLHSPQDVHCVPQIIEHLEQLSALLGPTRRKIDERVVFNRPRSSRQAWQRQSAPVPSKKSERKARNDS